MSRWHDALRAYRRRSLDPTPIDRSRAMFVLCSEDAAGAELVAAWNPAVVLQTFGGAPSDAGVRATFEVALAREGVRHVFVCTHRGCRATAPGTDAARAAVDMCRALLDDPVVGALLRERRAKLHALTLDPEEGDLYVCDVERERATLLGDEDVGRLLSQCMLQAS